MKKSASKRNRHTGRINAAKRHILEKGEISEASDGTRYRSLQTGVVEYRDPADPLKILGVVPKYTTVRVPRK